MVKIQELEKPKLNRVHKIHLTLTTIVLISLILMGTTIFYMSQNISLLKININQLNQTQNDVLNQITDNKIETQNQVNELRDSLLSTKKDLTIQFNELKAEASADFSGVIQEVIPAVVSVGTDVSQGSGFIISEEGYIVTNAHVLSGGHFATVLTYESNEWISAEFIGYDDTMDIAILKIPGKYEYLKFENSDNLEVGEKAIAIGNPLGLSFSVTEGIISALNREGPNQLSAYIQIDTPLNSGNSGGPLVNKKAKVIGVNNFKIKGGENLGFALESNYVITTINKILENAGKPLRI